MPEGSFEPTVMFFGLTNSPATFQAMMNDLLRDLVVEEKVAVFIDDVMIATETEEGHDEIVEEVLKRLEENNLFVKPEKYMWKVREVESQRSGVFRSDNRRRQSKNGERKSAGSYKMAGAKKYKGCAEVFGASKLL